MNTTLMFYGIGTIRRISRQTLKYSGGLQDTGGNGGP